MIVFADSSALVKLYADEEGYDQVRSLDVLAIAQLTRVEVPAAIWRKQRMGELAPEDAGLLTAVFEGDYFGTPEAPPRFVVLRTTDHVLDLAARYTATHGLRAYEAVQLATAAAGRLAGAGFDTFAAFDKTLRSCAVAEGFGVHPS